MEAMRRCVARYGAPGATFEHVAAEAGVSRGLLHYHFGTKEKLLEAVMHRQTEIVTELMRAGAEASRNGDDAINALLRGTEGIVRHDPDVFLVAFEMIGHSRREPSLAESVAAHNRAVCDEIERGLVRLENAHAVRLRATSRATAAALLLLSNGLALQMLERPDGDHEETIKTTMAAAGCILGIERRATTN
ncbi:MAG: TetR family transcriptional regulator [Actinobacteria bacterium]|nr:TetR family transcriptional regulator [Actinomycetota bacterium]